MWGWQPTGERDVVVAYLRSGTTLVAFAGTSVCRLCGVDNGGTELTDGFHFIWPDGFAQSVEAHDPRLPEDVVMIARRGPARPVDPFDVERVMFETGDVLVDERDLAAGDPAAAHRVASAGFDGRAGAAVVPAGCGSTANVPCPAGTARLSRSLPSRRRVTTCGRVVRKSKVRAVGFPPEVKFWIRGG
jgi:hypothetical protein